MFVFFSFTYTLGFANRGNDMRLYAIYPAFYNYVLYKSGPNNDEKNNDQTISFEAVKSRLYFL